MDLSKWNSAIFKDGLQATTWILIACEKHDNKENIKTW